jgi:hypothetical protein
LYLVKGHQQQLYRELVTRSCCKLCFTCRECTILHTLGSDLRLTSLLRIYRQFCDFFRFSLQDHKPLHKHLFSLEDVHCRWKVDSIFYLQDHIFLFIKSCGNLSDRHYVLINIHVCCTIYGIKCQGLLIHT